MVGAANLVSNGGVRVYQEGGLVKDTPVRIERARSTLSSKGTLKEEDFVKDDPSVDNSLSGALRCFICCPCYLMRCILIEYFQGG